MADADRVAREAAAAVGVSRASASGNGPSHVGDPVGDSSFSFAPAGAERSSQGPTASPAVHAPGAAAASSRPLFSLFDLGRTSSGDGDRDSVNDSGFSEASASFGGGGSGSGGGAAGLSLPALSLPRVSLRPVRTPAADEDPDRALLPQTPPRDEVAAELARLAVSPFAGAGTLEDAWKAATAHSSAAEDVLPSDHRNGFVAPRDGCAGDGGA